MCTVYPDWANIPFVIVKNKDCPDKTSVCHSTCSTPGEFTLKHVSVRHGRTAADKPACRDPLSFGVFFGELVFIFNHFLLLLLLIRCNLQCVEVGGFTFVSVCVCTLFGLCVGVFLCKDASPEDSFGMIFFFTSRK